MKRGASGLSGILAIDKPAGLSSHDVVNRVRRLSGERRVGHAGTLDPLATGLMFVGVGAATRLSRYLTGHDKSYRARICFGIATDTDDSMGRAMEAHDDLDATAVCRRLSELDADAVLAQIVGEQLQLPPAYSAIKKDGVTAYKAAREGSALDLKPRPVTVYAAKFIAGGVERSALHTGNGEKLPYWDIDVRVSKGTYIRAIARDLGARLGCGAHLSALRRTGVAAFGVDGACTLEQLDEMAASGRSLPWCDPVDILGYPPLALDAQQQRDVANGRALQIGQRIEHAYVSCVAGDKLLAVYSCDGQRCRPETVIPGGVAGVV